ncbi:hypothetical protein E3E14_28785 [Streptomyces sp. ICN441]|uniref:hypothetical protein n=1 Tax=Streptomyces sp. ICN441 TaxID=2558286 RepID=UPI001068FED3|nr:hypothetical protein [Streptomyces sp. ICN441]TFE38206.1 hypothetical protein E3E14_28785 [Streptomyces sp. ICN441]
MQVAMELGELEVLAAALVRMKFDEVEVPEPYFGSPAFSAAHNRILDSLILGSRESGDEGRARRWEGWREWSGREFEREVIVSYAVSLSMWDDWSQDQQIEILGVYCSPFSATSDDLEELRLEVDQRRRSNR